MNKTDQLAKLWELKQSGALNDTEYALAKSKVLESGQSPQTETAKVAPVLEKPTPEIIEQLQRYQGAFKEYNSLTRYGRLHRWIILILLLTGIGSVLIYRLTEKKEMAAVAGPVWFVSIVLLLPVSIIYIMRSGTRKRRKQDAIIAKQKMDAFPEGVKVYAVNSSNTKQNDSLQNFGLDFSKAVKVGAVLAGSNIATFFLLPIVNVLIFKITLLDIASKVGGLASGLWMIPAFSAFYLYFYLSKKDSIRVIYIRGIGFSFLIPVAVIFVRGLIAAEDAGFASRNSIPDFGQILKSSGGSVFDVFGIGFYTILLAAVVSIFIPVKNRFR